MLKIIKRVLTAFLRRLLYVISFPVALMLVLLSPFIKIRIVGLQSFRIGHYSLTTELMLCALELNNLDQKIKTIFYNMSKPCNIKLYKMWGRVIPIFPFARLAIQVDQCLSWIIRKSYRDDVIKRMYESCATGTIDKNGFLKKIEKPHLFFTEKEIIQARNIMRQLGIADNAQFICLVVRDSAYLNRHYPEKDWSYHNHRDASVASYRKAALYLANKGYYILRMGKYVNQSFDVGHPCVIDYANHPLRSDFMDIYLSANCFFCISTCTGLDCVSQIFRKPVLLTNISPRLGETLMWYPCTLFIPKLLKNIETNQFLTLSETAEICRSLASNNVLMELAKQNLTMVENNEDELLEVVKEMEGYLTNEWHETSEIKLQQMHYWKNYKKNYPISVNDIYIKIGADFLQQNHGLLN